MRTLFLILLLPSLGHGQMPDYPAEDDQYILSGEALTPGQSVQTLIQQSPAGAQTNGTVTEPASQYTNFAALSPLEIATIARSLPQMGAEITKAGLFPLLDAEARYYNNPDGSALAPKASIAAYARNPYLQFLYAKDIASGREMLSHKTNGTTFYNNYGVYGLRLGLLKDNSPLPKKSFEKRGEIEFVVFSKLRYAPPNIYGETIRLALYGAQNKKLWNKEFSFSLKQAQNQSFEGGVYSLTLNHLLEQGELEELRLLFRANELVFGKMEGSLNSFAFDFRPNAGYFYRIFLEYGKNNRYF